MAVRPAPASRAAVALLCIWALVAAPAGGQTSLELANYRLTQPVFERFERASELLASTIDTDALEPLFTREMALGDNAAGSAAALEARLRGEPALLIAVSRAGLTPREYSQFAIALIAARIAHGLIEEKILQSVRAGVPADNVDFVAAREADVDRVLNVMRVPEAVRRGNESGRK